MDAGWYFCDGNWTKTGTWEVATKRFPRGLRAISDYAHSNAVKTIVWFEPERVHPGTWLPENHPDWILGGKNGGLLDLGNPAALKWLIDYVFRRGKCIYKAADLRLYGLDPEVNYKVKNLDSPETNVFTGRQLMDAGVPVVLTDQPSAAVFRYERVSHARAL